MKKQILLALFAAAFSIAAVHAQPGGPRKTVEERVKDIDAKLADLKLDKEQATKVDEVFTTYFKDQQKAMEDARAAGGQQDMEARKAARKKLNDDRDAKLKVILTEAQYKKWKDEIEPTTRPQRGNGQQQPQPVQQ